jgi:hypothetical protein
VLYDKFVSDTRNLEYGFKPWYDPQLMQSESKVFSAEMYWISNDKLLSFDIRSHGSTEIFTIISQKFLDLLVDFSVQIKEIKPLKMVNSKNESITKTDYFVIRFRRDVFVDRKDAFDESSEIEWDEFNRRFAIIKPRIKSSLSKDFFKISNVDIAQNPIFCSDKFFRSAADKKLIGVDFMCLDDIRWGADSDENFLDFLSDSAEPLLFIN